MTEQKKTDPIRPTDDEARALAARLLALGHGALGTLSPETGAPVVTRVAWCHPLILASHLSGHTRALLANPLCSLLLGEPGDKGDALTHPRLTLHARARQVDKAAERDRWLNRHPKSALYFDFTDFIMLRLEVSGADLNGGFGKAFRLDPADLPDPGP